MDGIRCSALDIWTVAQTCYGEARGEGPLGMDAVAWVIRNRHDIHPRWKGRTLATICRAAYQFSCWNPGDPNRAALRTVSLDDRTFAVCLEATVGVIGGLVVSPVGRATHYYADTLREPPIWARGSPVAVVGHHIFFEGIS